MGCGDKFTEAVMSEMTKIKKTQEKYEIAMIAISLLLVVLFFIDDVIYGLLENKEINRSQLVKFGRIFEKWWQVF